MAETIFVGGLILGGPGARGSEVRALGVVRGKQPSGAGARGFRLRAPGVVSGVGRNLPGGSGCPGVTDLGGNLWENGRNGWIS